MQKDFLTGMWNKSVISLDLPIRQLHNNNIASSSNGRVHNTGAFVMGKLIIRVIQVTVYSYHLQLATI